MIRRRVVEARIAAHRETVLHHRKAVRDQLGVLHDLVRVRALVVGIGIDDLVVDELAVDREIAVLGAHADIGISLPGTGEISAAPIYIDGEKRTTLRGDRITEQFLTIIEDYVAQRWGASKT